MIEKAKEKFRRNTVIKISLIIHLAPILNPPYFYLNVLHGEN